MAKEDWRDKYLDAVEENDRKLRQIREYTSLLETALNKTSLVADGLDDRLDNHLAALRRAIRSESRSRIPDLVDELDKRTEALERKRQQRQQEALAALKAINAFFKQQNPSGAAKKALKGFEKEMKSRASSPNSYALLLKEIADLMPQVIDVGGDSGAGFWQRLLGGRSQASEAADLELAADGQAEVAIADELAAESTPDEPSADTEPGKSEAPVPEATPPDAHENQSAGIEPESALPSKTATVDSSTEPAPVAAAGIPEGAGASRINDEIAMLVSELLAQLELPKSAAENVASLRDMLDRGLSWYEYVPMVEELSLVVLAAMQHSRQEFEDFLAGLNQRLLNAQGSLGLATAGAQREQRLQLSLRQEMSRMRETVDSASDLQSLKTEVKGHLDSVLAALDQAQSEQQEELSLVDQLRDLADKVDAMDVQRKEAEEKLEEQKQKALRDPLTQLPNREAYNQRIALESERFKRYGRPLTMAVGDVDFFKKINDNFGHQAGDKVLRIIAKTLAKRFRQTDLVARIGGEEFVVLMPETEMDQAYTTVDAVREAISACPFHFRDKPLQITMSFGLETFAEGDSGDSVFGRADKALYAAKENGRNRVERADASAAED